jgi:hypothetical protein
MCGGGGLRPAVEQEMSGMRPVQGRRLFVHHGIYAQCESETLVAGLQPMQAQRI